MLKVLVVDDSPLFRRGVKDLVNEGFHGAKIGEAGNAFEMMDLFDEVYFLKASPALLTERLRHPSRQNSMGKTPFQLQNALNFASEIEAKALRRGITMIDADLTPEKIFKEITKR